MMASSTASALISRTGSMLSSSIIFMSTKGVLL